MKSVMFLGTSAGAPMPRRNVSSAALTFENGKVALIDCGEGTQQRLRNQPPTAWNEKGESVSVRTKVSRTEFIFVTHMHGDHVFGIPGLLSTLALGTNKSTNEMYIVGPKNLETFVTMALRLSNTNLNFELKFFELEPNVAYPDLGRLIKEKHPKFSLGKVDVSAFPVSHDPELPCYSYVFKEHNKQKSNFDARPFLALGVPNRMMGTLRNGQCVTLEDSRVINPFDILGEGFNEATVPGKKVFFSGDTAGIPLHWEENGMKEALQDCDLFIHECTFLSDPTYKTSHADVHSTPETAAGFAAAVNAKTLVLTHFSKKFDLIEKDDVVTIDYSLVTDGIRTMIDCAKATLPEGSEMRVFAAHDYMTIRP